MLKLSNMIQGLVEKEESLLVTHLNKLGNIAWDLFTNYIYEFFRNSLSINKIHKPLLLLFLNT